MARGRVAGRAGEQQQLGSDWIGWSGKVAHPDAPMGGGGPGFFDDGKGLSPDGAGSRDGDRLASPSRPGPMNDLNDNTVALKAPKPANPPPATKARSLGSQRSVQSTHVDVEITAAVKADGTGGPTNGAHTDFTMPAAQAPAYDSKDGKITKFKGKLTWKGSIDIQTKYGTGATAKSLSCYGRGTTSDDVNNRDITLGFHESCHIADFVAYLKANPLPEPPTLTLNMPTTDYDTASQEFVDAIVEYRKKMNAKSEKDTDEVGHAESTVDSKGCYVHTVP